MGKHIKWLVVALVAVLGFFAVRSCAGPSAKYYVKKALYDQAVADAAAQYQEDQAALALLAKTIAVKDREIAEKQTRIVDLLADARDSQAATGGLRAANRKLREDAQAAIDANPTLQALVRNFDLTIETQEKTISDLLGVIELKDGVISDWRVKFEAQVKISDTWKSAYENEHRLRLLSEDLNRSLEHQGKIDRVIGRVSMAGLAGAGAYILVTSIIHK